MDPERLEFSFWGLRLTAAGRVAVISAAIISILFLILWYLR